LPDFPLSPTSNWIRLSDLKFSLKRINYMTSKNDPTGIKTKDLIIKTVELGFLYFKPKSSTWRSAFIKRRGNEILCLLFRKNGLDFRYYENYDHGISLDEKKRITMIGGNIFRNHYNESKVILNHKALVIAEIFERGGDIYQLISKEEGIAYKNSILYQGYKNLYKETYKEKIF